MGMPVTIEIAGAIDTHGHEMAFAWFDAVDRRFSTYRQDSEISAINRHELMARRHSAQMSEVLHLADATRRQTQGYFNIRTPAGTLDPSGIVKGWAIRKAALLLADAGVKNFFVDAGGDVQVAGEKADGTPWRVGIRNPFDPAGIVKVLVPRGRGIATSGNYARGAHIYNPHLPEREVTDPVSLTVVAADVLEADRFATAAFAMGPAGIEFIEAMPGLEGYAIDPSGIATMTSGFAAVTLR